VRCWLSDSSSGNKLGEKAGFQWLLIVVAVIFFVLLFIVISWVLLLIGAQPWAQQVTAWLLGGRQEELADANAWRVQLCVVVFLTGAMLLFGIVIGFFIKRKQEGLTTLRRPAT
jgi:hypothetical protein